MRAFKLFLLAIFLLPLTIVYSDPTPQPQFFAIDKVTENVDGSTTPPVTAYTIYCGLQSGQYDTKKIVDLDDPNAIDTGTRIKYPIVDVATADGTQHCAATASNADGESDYSGELSFLVVAGRAVSVIVPVAPGFDID